MVLDLDLLSALNSPDVEVRMDALHKLRDEPSDARSKLVAILLEPSSGTRARVWAMLGLSGLRRTGDEAEHALVRCVDDPDPVVRRTAIDTLGSSSVDAAVSRIAGHLDDHEPVVPWFGDESTISQSAKRALRRIGSPEAFALLSAYEGGGSLEAERRDAADTSDDWYYCDAEKDDERCDGPVSFDQLVQLIRTGEIPHGVLISVDKDEWVEADTVEEVLRAIPLDRERMIRELIYYGVTENPEWGWASDRMYSLLENVPELAWELIVELSERAPTDRALGFFAASPLEDLLSKDGAQFIERVKGRAESSWKFRRAVGRLQRLGMTDDVWSRVCRIARRSNQ